MELTREELAAYADYLIGKPCPVHPNNIIKNGYYDIYCGSKTKYGSFCNGGRISIKWLNEYRKNEKDKIIPK